MDILRGGWWELNLDLGIEPGKTARQYRIPSHCRLSCSISICYMNQTFVSGCDPFQTPIRVDGDVENTHEQSNSNKTCHISVCIKHNSVTLCAFELWMNWGVSLNTNQVGCLAFLVLCHWISQAAVSAKIMTIFSCDSQKRLTYYCCDSRFKSSNTRKKMWLDAAFCFLLWLENIWSISYSKELEHSQLQRQARAKTQLDLA